MGTKQLSNALQSLSSMPFTGIRIQKIAFVTHRLVITSGYCLFLLCQNPPCAAVTCGICTVFPFQSNLFYLLQKQPSSPLCRVLVSVAWEPVGVASLFLVSVPSSTPTIFNIFCHLLSHRIFSSAHTYFVLGKLVLFLLGTCHFF